MVSLKEKILRLVDRGLTITYWLVALIGFYLLLSVFCFSTFQVPTDSMAPALLPGDQVLVSKMWLGPRLFNLFGAMKRQRVTIHRLFGLGKLCRGDILVFNDPYPYDYVNGLRMDLFRYFVKRCIGLPGDSLSVIDGFYRVKGIEEPQGYLPAQETLWAESEEAMEKRNFFKAWRLAPSLGWTMRNMGPLYVPRRGDRIVLNQKNVLIYKYLIEWESQNRLNVDSLGVAHLGGEPLKEYCFEHDYYFMVGDNARVSYDSRFWGLLPDDFIVGKVWLTLFSKEADDGTYRLNRLFHPVR